MLSETRDPSWTFWNLLHLQRIEEGFGVHAYLSDGSFCDLETGLWEAQLGCDEAAFWEL